jgi:antitoxin VapB
LPRKNQSLNVKNPEAHRLAQAIADMTGGKLTQAVTEALRERYERLLSRQGKASVEELFEGADAFDVELIDYH